MPFSFSTTLQHSFTRIFHTEGGAIGVDVGSSSIKIVELVKKKERAMLKTYGELSTGVYETKEEGRVVSLQDERVSSMLADLRREADVTSAKGFFSIPLKYSFITLIELPEMPERDLASAIPYEARKYIPLPIHDVYLDWQTLSLSSEERKAKRGKVPVLLIASQKDTMGRFVRIAKNAGIKVKGFEVETFSVQRAVAGQFRMPVLLIDIGASSTKISVSEHGSIRAAYGIEKGSQNLTLTLSKAIGVDFERAEEMKREVGIVERPENAEVRLAFLPVLDALLVEAERLRSFYRKKTGTSVDKIIFTGGGALLPGLVEYAAKHFGIEVLLGNPFGMLEYPLIMEPIAKRISPSFGVAVGLGLRALE